MESSSRILLLLGPDGQNSAAVALGLGLRLAKTQPVELYSDTLAPARTGGVFYFNPESRPAGGKTGSLLYKTFCCHRCTHWNCPPRQPVAVIDAQGRRGAQQLTRWAAPLRERGYEFYALIQPFAPPSHSPKDAASLLRQAQRYTGLQLCGLIHCPAAEKPIAPSLEFVRACAEALGTPVVLHAAPSAWLQQLSKQQRQALSCLSLGDGLPKKRKAP